MLGGGVLHQIWDVRVGHAVRSFFGPHIAGDAVDVLGGVVLTGSWRPEAPLEVGVAPVPATSCGCTHPFPEVAVLLCSLTPCCRVVLLLSHGVYSYGTWVRGD